MISSAALATSSSPAGSPGDSQAPSREVRPAPDRYRNAIGRYTVRRSADCVACGLCAELCPQGVHSGRRDTAWRCARATSSASARTARRPTTTASRAARSRRSPCCAIRPPTRWATRAGPPTSSWRPGTRPRPAMRPPPGSSTGTAQSGGGFDQLRFGFPETPAAGAASPARSTPGLDLNRRDDGRPQVHIDVPVYGGGMSFGSVSIHTMLAQARAAAAWNTFTCTGEGGYPDRLKPYDDHVITQVATGPVRRARGDHPAGAHGRVQVRPGRQAGPGRPPAGRQEHAGRGARCARRSRATPSSRPSRSTASTRSRTTRSTWTGSRRSTRGRWSR